MTKTAKMLTGVALSGSLALCGILPMMASADVAMNNENTANGQATTQLTLQYIENAKDALTDPEGTNPEEPWLDATDAIREGDNVVHYAVPATIPMAFKADGTLICASGDAYKIDNKSVMDLNMTNVTVNPGTDYKINGIGSGTKADITLGFNAGAAYDAATAIQPKADGQKTLSSVITVPTEDLSIAFGGEVADADPAEFTAAKPVGTLTWSISLNGTIA